MFILSDMVEEFYSLMMKVGRHEKMFFLWKYLRNMGREVEVKKSDYSFRLEF